MRGDIVQYKINNGSFSYGGNLVLDKINFEIRDREKIAIVGRNGCGKTTLLKIISGELELDRDDATDSSIIKAGIKTIGTLSQIVFEDNNCTLIEEIRKVYREIIDLKLRIEFLSHELENDHSDQKIKEFSALQEDFNTRGGYYFEKEYETVIKKFGFNENDKNKPLSDFSGGQRTKIAFIKLLLSKPDILLLDEPTNHLDIESVEWLEDFIRNYEKSVVIVSHDRMFLDNTVGTVYEIEYNKIRRYDGNYTEFAKQKKVLKDSLLKQHNEQIKEIERLENLVERFRYKATKAKMAQSKLKAIERIELIEAPEKDDTNTFFTDFTPKIKSFKDVLSCRNLAIGYEQILATINLDVQRYDRIGIIGNNGTGKSTLLKTIIGKTEKISGELNFGQNVECGYFDQQIAANVSNKTIIEDFWDEFPALSQTEVRNALGAFRFSGEDVFKKISSLSGGEKVRLNLCKIFKKRPNFLILDEPTNHMDIVGKEALEDILEKFEGTVLFVSHDRYFVQKIATSLLIFNGNSAKFFPYGYDEFIAKNKSNVAEIPVNTIKTPKQKKAYTTPGKEKAKIERQIKTTEQKIKDSEEKLLVLNNDINNPNNISNYKKLEELSNEIEKEENIQLELLEQLEELYKRADGF